MATAFVNLLTKMATPTLTGLIISQVATAIAAGSSENSEELSKLRVDTEREELSMRKAEAQAKVAQELAIARRIEEADEVHLEEFYEYFGEGSLGLKATEKTTTAGLSASGRRISKRVYRFIGRQGSIIDEAVVVPSSPDFAIEAT